MIADDRIGTPAAASFRDPAGRLFRLGNRVFRAVNSTGVANVNSFLDSPRANRSMAAGHIIGTRRLDVAGSDEIAALLRDTPCEVLLEHDCVQFASFPYEWPPEMLYEAAALTLDLALRLQADGLGLKDATPYNILFRGPQPVLVDVLSLERRQPGDSSWLPYAQFVRTFLLPLLAHKHFGMALDELLLTRRDGIEPEEIYRWTGAFQRCFPSFLGLVTLPTWLGRHLDRDDRTIYRRRESRDPEKAAFILRSLLKGLHEA